MRSIECRVYFICACMTLLRHIYKSWRSSSEWKVFEVVHGHSHASTECIQRPRVETSSGQRSFALWPAVWNSLPHAFCDNLPYVFMAAQRSTCGRYIFALWFLLLSSLWSPYVIGQTIIFLLCDFYLSCSSFFFFPRLISAAVD